MNSILAFWFAYVVTRPVGASVADWLAVSSARGGLALGTGPVSLVLAAAIAGFVYYLAKTGKDTPPDQRGFEPSDAVGDRVGMTLGGREQAPEQI